MEISHEAYKDLRQQITPTIETSQIGKCLHFTFTFIEECLVSLVSDFVILALKAILRLYIVALIVGNMALQSTMTAKTIKHSQNSNVPLTLIICQCFLIHIWFFKIREKTKIVNIYEKCKWKNYDASQLILRKYLPNKHFHFSRHLVLRHHLELKLQLDNIVEILSYNLTLRSRRHTFLVNWDWTNLNEIVLLYLWHVRTFCLQSPIPFHKKAWTEQIVWNLFTLRVLKC